MVIIIIKVNNNVLFVILDVQNVKVLIFAQNVYYLMFNLLFVKSFKFVIYNLIEFLFKFILYYIIYSTNNFYLYIYLYYR